MSEPVRASDSPFAVDVEKDKYYSWCACGLSKSQPFCDGRHLASDIRPIQYLATETKTVYFCGCKQSKTPICDGSHNS